jgi:hypothetical protein
VTPFGRGGEEDLNQQVETLDGLAHRLRPLGQKTPGRAAASGGGESPRRPEPGVRIR